jgi:hypothetical protein
MGMSIDLTGIDFEGSGGIPLSPGTYRVEVSPDWNASESSGGHISLYIPLTVLDEGEFKGVKSAYYHTIMTSGEKDKIIYNKILTGRLLHALGLISLDDKGEKGALKIDFDYGDEDGYGRVPVNALVVNGEKRSLGGKTAIAIAVKDDNNKRGYKIDRLEPDGKPNTEQTVIVPAQPQSKSDSNKKFPF